MELSKNIGANLQSARKTKGYTQQDVADKLGMTQQQYSRFETGRFELNYAQIMLLCSLFDITPNDLFDVDDIIW